jgi:hypothetical protein
VQQKTQEAEVQGAQNNNNNNNSDDSNSDVSDGSEEESTEDSSTIDRRTAKRIKLMEERAAENANSRLVTSDKKQIKQLRRSAREKKQLRKSGLVDLDEFGQLAFTLGENTEEKLRKSHESEENGDMGTVSAHSPSFSVSSSPSVCDSSIPPFGSIRTSDVFIPTTRRSALSSPHSRCWVAAMDSEIASLKSHHTYSLVDRPDDSVNIVTGKWVFAIKSKDGYVNRFKARWVARGFTQQYGVDYEETYSPVLKYKTLRLLLAITAINDLELELMDVQTAYLNAPLNERVMMVQPEGYEEGGKQLVCLLHKALYGLKQAGREWNKHLDSFVQSLGFTRCVTDTCLYVKKSRTGHMMLLSVYVDDIPSAFAECDRVEWEEMKKSFFDKYKIKFLGAADWVLNMRITRNREEKRLYLDQQAYVEQMLEEFNMSEVRTVTTPGSQEELSRSDGPRDAEGHLRMRSIPYRRVVGTLMYLSNTSRPDITHSVHVVSQYAQNPGEKHWAAVKQILRYLCGTTNYGLKFEPNGEESTLGLTVFADASWANCVDSRRSTTGWAMKIGEQCWIDWNSHKQETVALSTCEAEYMAIGTATQGILWTQQMLREIAVVASNTLITPIIYSDNKSAICMSKNDVHHNRSKHIDIRHHFIRDEIAKKSITLEWVTTGEQIADILTKSLPPRLFVQFRDKLVVKIPTKIQDE